jgi:hypothetical protein
MAYSPAENVLIGQAIADSSTTQKHELGTIIRCKDPSSTTLGTGEFIYLKGINSTVVGSIVNYDDNWLTALDTAAVAGPSRPLAVAMSACVTGSFGWYQISGMAVAVKSNAVSFADGVGIGSASGLAVAVATGTVIQGAVVRAVASAKSDVTSVRIAISRPHGPSDVS